ncbi:3-keto-disaccharide hydrolase [Posidoniimonas polymericola]|uniref:3-keto-disaccharide hydrolase n=1 Tax=Posidoniimonas polymericola TaxID=2528002 RepID=UPI0018D4856C|nr:DUF1080 domain-containing protein [Posidoniimonas polymericola]
MPSPLQCATALAALSVFVQLAPAAEPTASPAPNGFRELFNGQSLDGWEGAPGWWEVRDGVLTAESTPEHPCERSHYLYWTGGEPANFELRMVYRLTGAANSGVQFRSRRRPDFDTWGYQADADSANEYTGCLYQHERGLVALRGQRVTIDADGAKSIETFADAEELLAAVHDNDWNEYRVVADGPHITLWINGRKMCEATDHQPRFALPSGVIALQMHQGPPMKAEFKSIRLREFTRNDQTNPTTKSGE